MARAADFGWPSLAITATAVAVTVGTRVSPLWILIAGVSTAAYVMSDAQGVRHAGPGHGPARLAVVGDLEQRPR